MGKCRYIEKTTGKWWNRYGCATRNDIRYILVEEWDGGTENEIPEDEFNERFEYKPFESPSVDIEPVIPRHPIHIVLRCPVCGSPLRVKGGAILTYPVQYENECSNKDCKYGGICTSSYYSGMYAAVTEEQEKAIADGTYKEQKHGEIIQLYEKDLWKFKD